jgi:DNA-binding response OmpR family regulator
VTTTTTHIHTSSANLLICDDDPSTRGLVRATLERPGVTISEAQGAEDLDRCVRSAEPDLLVLDIRLGDDDGLDVLERLRDEGLLVDVPIVVVSILADSATRSRAVAAGVHHFMPKPFSPGRLQALVEELLRAR